MFSETYTPTPAYLHAARTTYSPDPVDLHNRKQSHTYKSETMTRTKRRTLTTKHAGNPGRSHMDRNTTGTGDLTDGGGGNKKVGRPDPFSLRAWMVRAWIACLAREFKRHE